MPRLDSVFLHLPFMNVVSDKDAIMLYLLRAVRDVANKFALFFLPIYLFTLGVESDIFYFLNLTTLQAGMLAIATYFLVNRTVIFITAIEAGRLTHKFGFQKSLLTSYLIRVASFLALYFSVQYPLLILLAAALEGLQSNFFWNSFFTLLTQHTPKRHIGADLGLLQFVLQLIAVLSPLLSGLVVIAFGFDVLFLTGVMLSFLSVGIVLMMKLTAAYDQVSWKEFSRWMREPAFRRLTLSFAGRYLNDSVLFVWPLYIFLLVGSVDRVGFIYTFSLFVAMVMTFFIGIYIDKTKSKKPFFFSGTALTAIWLARSQVFTIWGVALADSLDRFFANFHWLYYDMLSFRRGKGGQAFSYFVYREVIMSIGAIIFWSIFAVYFMVFASWIGLFLLAGIGVLLSMLVTDKYIPNGKK